LFESSTDEVTESLSVDAQLRQQLLDRVATGDLHTLDDAGRVGQTNVHGEAIYSEILEAFIERAERKPGELDRLVSYISSSSELRTNERLARRVIEDWRASPGSRSATEMLHIAALSDNATTYHKAVDALVESLEIGGQLRLSTEDLISLVQSEYWVLASEARQGGAGFALRKRIAGIRRELAARMSAR
jgi:hypothetical protein